MVTADPHPLLDLVTFRTRWPASLGSLPSPDWLRTWGATDAPSPFAAPDASDVEAVRALLRHGGFKPAGRSKPCSEYIRKAAAEGRFPWINAAVDATNLAALHGALPVSTVDPDRLRGALRVAIAAAGSAYVFNASGQTIDVAGLLCLFDADGPCANAVKDSLRAKTVDATRETVTVIWGTKALPGRAAALRDWHVGWVERIGGTVSD